MTSFYNSCCFSMSFVYLSYCDLRFLGVNKLITPQFLYKALIFVKNKYILNSKNHKILNHKSQNKLRMNSKSTKKSQTQINIALDNICGKISEIFPSDNVTKNILKNHSFIIYLDVSDLIRSLKPVLKSVSEININSLEDNSIDTPGSLTTPEESHTIKSTSDIPSGALPEEENPVWEEYPKYHELKSPQLSKSWFKARKNRITGSKAGCAMGLSKFTSPEKAALEICGKIPENEKSKPNPKLQAAADHGIKTEPIVRDIYQIILRHMSKTNVEIIERGLCVPKWHQFIGSSVDGDILNTDGIIEIKCPLRMYGPLARAVSGHNHIWKTHYVQMQLGMIVLGKKFCDYLVYCEPSQELFIQRVLFNKDFWNKQMVPKLNNFFKVHMKPLMTELPADPREEHSRKS